jgi:hypothetical protein
MGQETLNFTRNQCQLLFQTHISYQLGNIEVVYVLTNFNHLLDNSRGSDHPISISGYIWIADVDKHLTFLICSWYIISTSMKMARVWCLCSQSSTLEPKGDFGSTELGKTAIDDLSSQIGNLHQYAR